MLAWLTGRSHQLPCGFRDDKTIEVGSQKLIAEVANTPAARQQGLSGRSCIGTNEAMLFVFNKPGQYYFWMKDMKFPIDIVWLTPSLRVAAVKQNIGPSTYPQSFHNRLPAQYVLEMQAGRAKELGLLNSKAAVNFK